MYIRSNFYKKHIDKGTEDMLYFFHKNLMEGSNRYDTL